MVSDDFKLLSLNVRGLSNFKKRRAVFTWCRKQKASIIFLQETHSTIDKEKQWKAEWGAPIEFAHGSSNARGAAILLRNGFDCKIKRTIVDPMGRYIGINAEIKDENYLLFNVYAPNNDSQSAKFYEHIVNVLKKEDQIYEDRIIIGGDFNCPLNPSLDKMGGLLTTRKKIVDQIENIQNIFNVHDVWRIKHPNQKSFTWSQKSPFIFCRLDYWLISDSLHDMVANVDIVSAIKTDHSAITLQLHKIEEGVKGPGFWKMNTSMLNDAAYVEEVKKKILIWREEAKEISDKRVIWDWIKYNVRLFSIDYSKRRAKANREEEEMMQKKYQAAQAKFEQNPCVETRKVLEECKMGLERFYDKKTEGIIVRSRARWHEHGEKSNKYFLNLEKRNHTRKHIRKLSLSGVITTDHKQILNSASDYYKNLYSSKSNLGQHESFDSFFKKLNIPKLNEEQRTSCEGLISREECKKAIEMFENGKTPGNDGIPIEFYKKLWDTLADQLVDVFNYSFQLEEMTTSQRQAIITLIGKKGKDRSYLENWRPISLVNVDAKIASKVIANRIKCCLPDIIHHNQSGFIKDRFIGETARSILDIIDYTERSEVPGMMIFIDFEKAFDSIEWCFLYECLEAFNFGPEFIKWVKTFYKNVSSCVINNGVSSPLFKLERGVRQGDPLSPYLFVVAIEILAISIRSNTKIKGITIGDNETKLLAYADDMTALLSDITSAKELLDSLNTFEKFSGLKMNVSKTKAVWIGTMKNSVEKPLGLEWCTTVKNLGVQFSCDQKVVSSQNFQEKLDKIQKVINIWNMRGLSLFGRVTIIKTFLIPKLLYLSSIIQTPMEIIKRMERMFFKFLWKGPDKVTRHSVINSVKNGGLNLMDIETQIKALRLSWIPRILDSTRKGPWKSYFNHYLKPYRGTFLLKCNYEFKDLTTSLNGFYSDLLLWWEEFRNTFSDNNYAQRIVWNNKDIKIDNRSVFYKSYYDKGIVFVRDLMFESDNKQSHDFYKQKGLKTDFLTWTGLRLSVPKELRSCEPLPEIDLVNFKHNNIQFDVYRAKCKHFYKLLITAKAKLPNMSKKLISDFDISNSLEEIYSLPQTVASETYIWSFQYRVLNYILYTNAKLFKIGLSLNDKCTFCDSSKEELYHLFFECSHVQIFWKTFSSWWFELVKENITLTLKDIILGLTNRTDIINYLIILGKLCIWECRKAGIYPDFNIFLKKVKNKFETEKYIANKNGTFASFRKRWEAILAKFL